MCFFIDNEYRDVVMRKKPLGFTLVELLIGIVILGILAAFALPRLVSLDKDARASLIQSLGGSVRTAATLAHGKSLSDQLAENATVTVEGVPVEMIHGYPTNTAIDEIVLNKSGFDTFLLDGSDEQESGVRWVPKTTSKGFFQSCYVQYQQAAKNEFPNVQVVTTDCG